MSEELKNIVAEQAETIRKLNMQIEKLQKSSDFVGIRNTFPGSIIIPVLGADRKTGDGDVYIPGKEARPVPAGTWEHLVAKNHEAVKTGQLVRDDSILGSYGKIASDKDYNEREKFPEGLTDDDIEIILSYRIDKFKGMIEKFKYPHTLERIIEIASSADEKKYKHIEVLSDKLKAINSVIPQNIDSYDREQLINLGYMYDIPEFDPESFNSNLDLKSFIIEGLKSVDQALSQAKTF